MSTVVNSEIKAYEAQLQYYLWTVRNDCNQQKRNCTVGEGVF
jgi:hypothetical protein